MSLNFGKIGFFDSGLGGLTILKEAVNELPQYSYLYLGDNLRAPYGDKSVEDIYKHTLAGVEWLFSQGAELTILACNTASAVALRRLQQEIMPLKYPNKKVLGIIIPTAEEAEKFTQSRHIGILATEATVRSEVFQKEMRKNSSDVTIACKAGGRLVEMIESDVAMTKIAAEIDRVVAALLEHDPLIDVIILGCTHYALIAEEIRRRVPEHIVIVNEAPLVVAKIKDYLGSHSQINNKLRHEFELGLFTTAKDENTKKLIRKFYGEPVDIGII